MEAKQIHIYHVIARENQLDNRFFSALIRPGRIRIRSSGISSFRKTDHLVLEIVSAQHRTADCNHIFMSFICNLPVEYEDVLAACAISCFCRATWEAAFGVCTLQAPKFVVNYHGYQEITIDKGSSLVTVTKVPFICSLSTKFTQPRSHYSQSVTQAHLIGTTYVYDFPDPFSKALHNVWVAARKTDPLLVLPNTLLESRELVLDKHDQLKSTRQ